MTAALIAEALAHAESVTPERLGEHFRISIEDEAGCCSDYVDSLRGDIEQRLDDQGRYPFVRWDCMAAALARLAERAERAEAALKAAEARIYLLRDTLYLIEGEFSASSERARLSRERDEALRDGAKEADRG